MVAGGGFYANPVETVLYTSMYANSFVADLAGLTDGTSYAIGVRAYNATAEEQNTNTVILTADATGPAAVDSLSGSRRFDEATPSPDLSPLLRQINITTQRGRLCRHLGQARRYRSMARLARLDDVDLGHVGSNVTVGNFVAVAFGRLLDHVHADRDQ